VRLTRYGKPLQPVFIKTRENSCGYHPLKKTQKKKQTVEWALEANLDNLLTTLSTGAVDE
jgi:hypothetical protein